MINFSLVWAKYGNIIRNERNKLLFQRAASRDLYRNLFKGGGFNM